MFNDGSPNTVTVTLAAAQQQSGTDFTEMGLKPQYISLRLFRSSAGSIDQVLRSLFAAPVVDLNGAAQAGTDATSSVNFAPGGAAVAMARAGRDQ